MTMPRSCGCACRRTGSATWALALGLLLGGPSAVLGHDERGADLGHLTLERADAPGQLEGTGLGLGVRGPRRCEVLREVLGAAGRLLEVREARREQIGRAHV